MPKVLKVSIRRVPTDSTNSETGVREAHREASHLQREAGRHIYTREAYKGGYSPIYTREAYKGG